MFYEKQHPISGFNTHNIPKGVSDCHNLISTTIKGNLPVQDKRKISFRSYRYFDIDKLDSDLQKVVISENSDKEMQVK